MGNLGKLYFCGNFNFWRLWSSRYLKNFEMCFIFSSLLGHFVKGFWIFEVTNQLKVAQYCVVWKILKNRNFEKISIFEVCSDSRMHKMNSWDSLKHFFNFKFSTIILDSFRTVWFETLYFFTYLFEVRTWAFWMFWFKIRYFSNILVRNTISFPCFRYK